MTNHNALQHNNHIFSSRCIKLEVCFEIKIEFAIKLSFLEHS